MVARQSSGLPKVWRPPVTSLKVAGDISRNSGRLTVRVAHSQLRLLGERLGEGEGGKQVELVQLGLDGHLIGVE